MIWLTWRQFRTQALVTGALLMLVLLGLVLTRSPLSDLARATGLTGCTATSCAEAAQSFGALVKHQAAWQLYLIAAVTLLLFPAVIGIFWGAPLVAREMESGTFRMIFSQSVSRPRWLIVKLLAGSGAVALGAGLLGLIQTWWATPIDTAVADRMSPVLFAARGVVPIGYAVLAFVLGATTGLIVRRTVAAMAVTLFMIAGLQVAVPVFMRPRLVQQSTEVSALDTSHITSFSSRLTTGVLTVVGGTETAPPGAWVIENLTITPDGREFTGPADRDKCLPGYGGTTDKCWHWLAEKNLRQKLVYVPATRFWTLQWRELGLLLVLALALSGFSMWWIRR